MYFCKYVNISLIFAEKQQIMLVQFSIKNYKTFKDEVTLSMVASNYDKSTRINENVFFYEKYHLNLLKSAVVYGANASGKTKIIEAFHFFRTFLLNSFRKNQQGDPIPVEPFLLNTETENQPSRFEIIFLYNNILYRYGFEADKKKVLSEWLYYKPKTKEVKLFYREENTIEVHERNLPKSNILKKENFVRENTLFLSVAAQFNEEITLQVIQWVKSLKILSGLDDLGYKNYTADKIRNTEYKEKVLTLLEAADLGIQNIKIEEESDEDVLHALHKLPKEFRENVIRNLREIVTFYNKYDKNKNPTKEHIGFFLDSDESAGTRKFFSLAGPIIDVLENGYVLIVDELDAKLHPNLVEKIVALFNSKTANPNNAQLIFNTHNTNLLNANLFRRDQIWFVKKNRYGEADLYSLADFKATDVRKTESFEVKYINGKYSAVPYLGFFDEIENSFSQHEKQKQ